MEDSIFDETGPKQVEEGSIFDDVDVDELSSQRNYVQCVGTFEVTIVQAGLRESLNPDTPGAKWWTVEMRVQVSTNPEIKPGMTVHHGVEVTKGIPKFQAQFNARDILQCVAACAGKDASKDETLKQVAQYLKAKEDFYGIASQLCSGKRVQFTTTRKTTKKNFEIFPKTWAPLNA